MESVDDRPAPDQPMIWAHVLPKLKSCEDIALRPAAKKGIEATTYVRNIFKYQCNSRSESKRQRYDAAIRVEAHWADETPARSKGRSPCQRWQRSHRRDAQVRRSRLGCYRPLIWSHCLSKGWCVMVLQIDPVTRHEQCSDDESDSYPWIGYHRSSIRRGVRLAPGSRIDTCGMPV